MCVGKREKEYNMCTIEREREREFLKGEVSIPLLVTRKVNGVTVLHFNPYSI